MDEETILLIKKLNRECEIKKGLYCNHLRDVDLSNGNYIINSNGKKVCNECCDHTSGFEPFINDDIKEVCIICCDHRRAEDDSAGNRFCLECFVMLPQLYSYDPKEKKPKKK